jgi:hypothetical protein
VSTLNPARFVTLSRDDKTAYVVADNLGMLVIDVSDPLNATVLKVMTAPSVGSIAVYEDNTTYILASGPGGFTTNSFVPRHQIQFANPAFTLGNTIVTKLFIFELTDEKFLTYNPFTLSYKYVNV